MARGEGERERESKRGRGREGEREKRAEGERERWRGGEDRMIWHYSGSLIFMCASLDQGKTTEEVGHIALVLLKLLMH